MKQIHGGDVYRHPHVIDFSSNMNPLGTPERVKEAAKKSMEHIMEYPDVFQEKLIQALSAYEDVPSEWLICGNGAAELIFSFAFAFRPKTALLLAPTFAEYAQALHASGCLVRRHLLVPENDFQVTDALLSEITDDLDLLLLCNPNNPTGQVIEPELMKKIAERCKNTHTFLMIDECFQDFLDEGSRYSMKPLLSEHPGMFLLKAFTKRYAMAGIRLGYGISSDSTLLEQMRDVMQPWNVSVPAQAAGVAALQEKAYVDQALQLVKTERAWLKEMLTASGFKVYASYANYVFFHGPEGLVERLLKKDILIRDCSNYPGLERGYYRIAVRKHEDNLRLAEALKEVSGQ